MIRTMTSRLSNKLVCHWRIATLLAAVIVVISPARPAIAQASAECRVSDYVKPAISALRSDTSDKRPLARTLVESWRASLPALMQEISELPKGPVASWSQSEKQYAAALTDTVKTILATTDQAIQVFRQCDNDRVVKALAWAARSDETALRINSANILGNVVDNTTLCFVLHHLRDPAIDMRGRANLLGVAVAVASYAYKENVQGIDDTLAALKDRVQGDGLAQTQRLILELGERAKRSTNGSISLPDSLGGYCKAYSYSGPAPN
jgi:hypothetical protein